MKGFTLIELLVVVLMIGALTAIALPQYEKAVEKARATEGLIMAKAVRDAIERHFVEFPDVAVTSPSQIADVKIPKNTYMGAVDYYIGKHFFGSISNNAISVIRVEGNGLSDKISNASGGRHRYAITYTYNPSTSSWSVTKECTTADASICSLFDL